MHLAALMDEILKTYFLIAQLVLMHKSKQAIHPDQPTLGKSYKHFHLLDPCTHSKCLDHYLIDVVFYSKQLLLGQQLKLTLSFL